MFIIASQPSPTILQQFAGDSPPNINVGAGSTIQLDSVSDGIGFELSATDAIDISKVPPHSFLLCYNRPTRRGLVFRRLSQAVGASPCYRRYLGRRTPRDGDAARWRRPDPPSHRVILESVSARQVSGQRSGAEPKQRARRER